MGIYLEGGGSFVFLDLCDKFILIDFENWLCMQGVLQYMYMGVIGKFEQEQ